MKKKILLSAISIIAAIAMIVGGTMAWFTSTADGGETTFTAGTVRIEAGQIINIPEEGNHQWITGNIFPNWVIGSQQGLRYDGKPVVTARSNPQAVLTLGKGQSEENFFSLGFGGQIEVEFSHVIFTGDEVSIITVVEDTWGSNFYPEEKASVFVSQNGIDWILVGTASNQPTSQGNQIKSTFTLPAGIEYARYVKLVDTTEREAFAGLPTGTRNAADGFDVNAIYVNGAYKDRDHNWNPGDSTKKEYYVENTGTKNIHVRGQLIGKWYEYDEESYQWIEFYPVHEDQTLEVVTIEVCEERDDWVYDSITGYFYYLGELEGTFGREEDDFDSTTLCVRISIAGEDTDNQYQGKRFVISTTFEAIQSSNNAAQEAWGVNFYSLD